MFWLRIYTARKNLKQYEEKNHLLALVARRTHFLLLRFARLDSRVARRLFTLTLALLSLALLARLDDNADCLIKQHFYSLLILDLNFC